ncbi:hypothetical protein SSX86_002477 [Deinandra increscens subsp. villosa]|uniref:Uncharacterized protein n=1 Tax=Deinandra increscens subsp. villosa TaxID=3103831 RepID=A0AAP0HD73_9ASTR
MSKRPRSEPSTTIPAGSTDAGGFASTDPLRALSTDIKKFETDPKTFIESLNLPVHSNIRFQIKWFKKLVKAWKTNQPGTPLDDTRLLFGVIKEVRPARVDLGDLEGIMQHYGLPQYTDVLQEDWEASQEKDTPKSVEEEQYEKLCASAPFTWSDEEELYKWDGPTIFTWSDRDLEASDDDGE